MRKNPNKPDFLKGSGELRTKMVEKGLTYRDLQEKIKNETQSKKTVHLFRKNEAYKNEFNLDPIGLGYPLLLIKPKNKIFNLIKVEFNLCKIKWHNQKSNQKRQKTLIFLYYFFNLKIFNYH